MRQIHIILILLFHFSLGLSGQRMDHHRGDILVQLKKGTSPNRVADKYPDLQSNKCLSKTLNIWKFTFDALKVNEYQLLSLIQTDQQVINAQFNHFVQMRSTIPDDPLFNNQWQYMNNGTNGGVPNADLDMDLAWDITTGGVTALGDTIVVCVIDGGIDLSHQDFGDNLWRNHDEIPMNGIDDDENGYIDDVMGWNVNSNDDHINGNNHGTAVAGIIGAKGNNNLGVSGINWNVKLMIVWRPNTGLESEVISAYEYPLIQRKRYNESNGATGAFVVATNASWGVDGGTSADAPLWCAIYDTLGHYGILNCGATINQNVNVEEFGDLPTTCPSDYLISVTNIRKNNIKEESAGYGNISIDLGAYGTGVFTTSLNNSYGAFGGTSGACPQVTGTIGLLYSIPCENIARLAREAPADAALLMKNTILNTTISNESLQLITVTEGHLNTNNALQYLMESCDDCFRPSVLESQNITDVEATLTWAVISSVENTDLQWRESNTNEWNEISGITTPFVLSGLMPCTSYEFRIKANCTDAQSQYSDPVTFTTDGCCIAPDETSIISTGPTSAMLEWTPVLAATSYIVQYREAGILNWNNLLALQPHYTIEGLENCTEYEYRIETKCGISSGGFTPIQTFRTHNCSPCNEQEYCIPTVNKPEEDWIDRFIFGDINNLSGDDGGYGNFSLLGSFVFQKGETYSLSITPGYGGFNYTENAAIWLDQNQNGTFENSEVIFSTPAIFNTQFDTSLIIPPNIEPGEVRLRVAMMSPAQNTVPHPCPTGNGTEYGELEDYCITIQEAENCIPTNTIDTSDLELHSVILHWTPVSISNNYTISYKKTGDPNYITNTTFNASYHLTDLEKCSNYEVIISSNCTNGGMAESQLFFFSTACDVNSLEINPIENWKLAPNPFNDFITLSIISIKNLHDLDLTVYNQLGQKVFVKKIDINKGANQFIISSTKWSNGIYLATLTSKETIQQSIQKIIKF